MSDETSTKLAEVLIGFKPDAQLPEISKVVDEIGQAFRDAGYERVISANLSANPSEWYMKIGDWIKVAHQVKPYEGGYRTGHNFYDRFKSLVELEHADMAFRVDDIMHDPQFTDMEKPTFHLSAEGYLELARLAAGLEEAA